MYIIKSVLEGSNHSLPNKKSEDNLTRENTSRLSFVYSI